MTGKQSERAHGVAGAVGSAEQRASPESVRCSWSAQYTGTDRFPPHGWLDLSAAELARLGVELHHQIGERSRPTTVQPCFAELLDVHTDDRGHARLPDGRMLYTLVFPLTHKRSHGADRDTPTSVDLLLGQKKRGFGRAGWNGFGGKVEPAFDGKTTFCDDDNALAMVRNAARRELAEECGLVLRLGTGLAQEALPFCGTVDVDVEDGERIRIYVFTAHVPPEMHSDVKESEEMRPEWFSVPWPSPPSGGPTATTAATAFTTMLGSHRDALPVMRPESPLYLQLVLLRYASLATLADSGARPLWSRFEVEVGYRKAASDDAARGPSRSVQHWSVQLYE